jgi:signal transduction histidine kinase
MPISLSSHLAHPASRAWLRLSRISIALVAVLVLGNSLALLIILERDRADALATQLRESANLASVLQEQTARVLASADQVTLRLAEEVREAASQPDLPRLANETGLAPRILVQLSLVGPNGRFIASNLDPTGVKTGAVDLSEREHVQVHLRSHVNGSSGLHIGKPVLGKVSKRWTLQLSRRITGAQGQLLGVAVASLDPAYFEEVYGQVQLGRLGVVSLVGDDLRVRAQVLGQQPQGMGTLLEARQLPPLEAGQRQAQRLLIETEDGGERVQALQRVGDYPLAVLVSTAVSETLDDWRSTRNLIVGFSTVAALLLILASIPFVRRLQALEAEHDRLQHRHALQLADQQARNQWLLTLSHRLRTPLTSLLGCAHGLRRWADDPALRQQTIQVQEHAELLNRLLDEIGDLARLETGSMPLHREPLALHPLIHAVTEAQRPAASAKGLALRVHFDPDVPERLVCDGLRVRQVLSRLLANAIGYTTQGEVVIELDTAPGWLRLHVADTGPGISAERQAQLLPQNTAEGVQPLSGGLGLTLAHALARHMGGTLTLESVPGMGTRFTLSLPMPD